MTRPNSIVKELSSNRGDRRIRVLMPNPGQSTDTTATFSEAEVERVIEIGEERSALVLRSGLQIPVSLSFEHLEQKIYEPDFKNDGPVLDLRAVTGKAVKPLVVNANDVRPETGVGDNAARRIGDVMPDGTVFAGISPDTNEPMYATPADPALTFIFNEAKEYVQFLNMIKTLGHDDWRVPTKNELSTLFNHRAAIGGFNASGSYPASYYWSSSQNNEWGGWGQRFSDGNQFENFKVNLSAIRPVR
jgi:hypothetical protein